MRSLHWADAVQRCERAGQAYALVTILGSSGSTPRDPASKMVVTAQATYDTIGGGNLEHTVTQAAREKIAQNKASIDIMPFPLGGALGQCCGGNATVLIETFAAEVFSVTLFGAGHVGQALISILSGLPYRVTWIDSRAALFPQTLPPNIKPWVCPSPADCVSELPISTALVILTHHHPLDYALVEAALHRQTKQPGAFPYIGLIGSNTKAERFRQRLAAAGFSDNQVHRVKCPIGLSAVPGKLPMEVAVSIAGELIAYHRTAHPTHKHGKQGRQGLAWTDIKQQLADEGATSK